MATPLSASTALAKLKAEGINVREVGSWRTHNRNSKGAWGPVNGVMIHHTAQSSDADGVDVCYDGRSGLPGPLCHGVGESTGRISMVGWGRANHAGLGDDDVLAAVIAEKALPADNEANTDGNSRFYGLEIVNAGNGDDIYQWEQYQAAVRFAASLCRAHGWNEMSVIGHSEWQPGKIDPRGPVEGEGSFTMKMFRADVKAALAQKPGVWKLKAAPAPAPQPGKPERKLEFLPVSGYMPELKHGDDNWYVDFMQRMINRFLKTNVKVDGKYGDATAKGVHQFYKQELDYTTKTGGKVFGADGWRRALSVAKDNKGNNT
jgi:hypothetical protein